MASDRRHKTGPGGPSKRPTPKPARLSAPTGQQAQPPSGGLKRQDAIPGELSLAPKAPRTPLFDSLPPLLPPEGRGGKQVVLSDRVSGRIPMEYRAQVQGRCQRQRIKEPKPKPPGWRSDIQIWIDEWVERVDRKSPFSTDGLRIVEVQIDWRLISNSGVDEGVIRPVIGAGGWPLIPGSGIKGLFRRACPSARQLRWCGSPCASGDLSPGILRFHGAWPAQATNQGDCDWTQGLLDVAHPQQNWQVGFTNGNERHSAFGVASLYRPRLRIGLSASDPSITETEWEEVIATLKQALGAGIGGRTCVGYGSTGALSGDVLFQCGLEGQGPAAKLLDGTAEFRPTMFRAAIRGMALRVFGGLTDHRSALKAVGRIFGSLSREEGQNVGLLATAYTDAKVELGSSGQGNWAQPVYATSGQLQWRLTRSPGSHDSQELLAELLAALHGLTLSLGGFGRGWRRPDHSIFDPEYGKTPIGCHWQWRETASLPAWIHVQSAKDLAQLLQRAQKLAGRWLEKSGVNMGEAAPWREVLHPQHMLIWTREAIDPLDAVAIEWFHWVPVSGEPDRRNDPRELKGTVLGGQVNHVGRIWNRLLPILGTDPVSKNPSVAHQAAVIAKSGAAFARPANPMARPGAATASPSAGAMARPSAPTSRPPAPRGEVTIAVHPGPFLETLVLFPEKTVSREFVTLMDRGANADFKRLKW
jgi:CRISPR-associated protein Cmr6